MALNGKRDDVLAMMQWHKAENEADCGFNS
jgi:hypothetical protein